MSDLPPPPPLNMAPPPGYVPYSGYGVVPQGTGAVRGIGKAIAILLIIMIPAQLIGLVQQFRIINAARDYVNGRISQAKYNDIVGNGLGSIGGLLVIPVAVLTMIWMFRMAKNLRILGRQTTWAPGWAIGGWFTPPCVVYAVPWLMFRELWKASDPDLAPGDQGWKQGTVPALVNVWWVLYGLVPLIAIGTSASYVAQYRSGSLDSIDVAKKLDRFAAINTTLSIVAIGTTVVYLLLVRQLTDRHARATREA